MNKKKYHYKQTEIGKIPKDWELKVLSEIADVNKNSINRNYVQNEIKYIDVSSTLKGRVLDKQILQLSKSPSRAKRIVNDNDILISTVRPNLNHFAYIKEADSNLIASTGYAVISSKKIKPRFLYYYLTTERYIDFLSAIADTTTSTYPAFNPCVLENSLIPIPLVKEQQQIASILSSLDNKIELNRKMNQTLEEMGKALFKHWFVDFEFPNNEGKPYKSSGGEMIDSEFGEIPKKWKVVQLNDFGEIVCGKTPPKKKNEYFDGEVSFIKIPDMHRQMFVVKTEDALTKEGMNFQKQKSLPENSICVSCIATVGLVCITSQLSQTNQQINSIIPGDRFYREYLYYTLSSMDKKLRDYASGGSATLNLNTGSFSKIYILKPCDETLGLFSRTTSDLFEKILMNEKENIRLASIRDSLLPRLMSGRIRTI